MRPRGITGAEPDHAPDTDLKRIHHALGLLPSSGCDSPNKLWASGVTGRGGSAPVSAPLAPAWATQAKGFASHSPCLRKRCENVLGEV